MFHVLCARCSMLGARILVFTFFYVSMMLVIGGMLSACFHSIIKIDFGIKLPFFVFNCLASSHYGLTYINYIKYTKTLFRLPTYGSNFVSLLWFVGYSDIPLPPIDMHTRYGGQQKNRLLHRILTFVAFVRRHVLCTQVNWNRSNSLKSLNSSHFADFSLFIWILIASMVSSELRIERNATVKTIINQMK